MNHIDYKPISILAVVSLIISIIAVLAFLATPMLACAIASMLLAAASLVGIRRHNLSGTNFAVASICIAAATLILAPMWHAYLFRSEILPGHQRVDFAAAKIDNSTALDQYASQAICLKGYFLPNRTARTRTFQLSPDGNDLRPEATITVTCPAEWDYEHAAVAVSGVLKVNPDAQDPAQRYTLAAEVVHRSQTSHGLAPRVPGRGC